MEKMQARSSSKPPSECTHENSRTLVGTVSPKVLNHFFINFVFDYQEKLPQRSLKWQYFTRQELCLYTTYPLFEFEKDFILLYVGQWQTPHFQIDLVPNSSNINMGLKCIWNYDEFLYAWSDSAVMSVSKVWTVFAGNRDQVTMHNSF